MYIHTHTHTHTICIYTHTHIYVYVYTHTHTHSIKLTMQGYVNISTYLEKRDNIRPIKGCGDSKNF